jgi:rubrerythrin
MVETIEFAGVTFRRYPNAKGRTERVYFTPGIADRAKGIGRLHEEIWKAEHGPIPDGWHIHHKDEDPLNNELANLEALPAGEHHRHHHARPATPAKKAHLDNVRHLAAEWHSSAAGTEWHAELARKQWTSRESRQWTCEHCGKPFEATTIQQPKYCSNNCKSAARRASGVDNETRTCVACGQAFVVNRYSRSKTCNGKCAWTLRRKAQEDPSQTQRPPDGTSRAAE